MTNAQAFLSKAALWAQQYDAPGRWIPPIAKGTIALSAGYPSPDVIPSSELAAVMRRLTAIEVDKPFQYSGSRMSEQLPQWIAHRLTQRGVTTLGSQRVLVTSGACQAIDLAARALLDGDSIIAVEAPTYMEALEIFRNYTPHILSYPVDSEGLQVDVLARDLKHRRQQHSPIPKVLYTIPSFQNPTGGTLSTPRRQQLLELADEYNFLIIEDDAYGELSFTAPIEPLIAQNSSRRVIHLGSFSKVIAPGLRVGFAVGPAEIIDVMEVLKKDLGNPLLEAITTVYLTSVDWEQRLQELRAFYLERRDLMVGLLQAHMPSQVSYVVPRGGYFIWLKVSGADTDRLLPTALVNGVAFVPGRHFFWEKQTSEYLRLSYSYVSVADLKTGVQRLAMAIRQA